MYTVLSLPKFPSSNLSMQVHILVSFVGRGWPFVIIIMYFYSFHCSSFQSFLSLETVSLSTCVRSVIGPMHQLLNQQYEHPVKMHVSQTCTNIRPVSMDFSRDLRKARETTQKLESDNRQMELRLQELKLAMNREREEREWVLLEFLLRFEHW